MITPLLSFEGDDRDKYEFDPETSLSCLSNLQPDRENLIGVLK